MRSSRKREVGDEDEDEGFEKEVGSGECRSGGWGTGYLGMGFVVRSAAFGRALNSCAKHELVFSWEQDVIFGPRVEAWLEGLCEGMRRLPREDYG